MTVIAIAALALLGCGKKAADPMCAKVTACCTALSPDAHKVGKVDLDCSQAEAGTECDLAWGDLQHALGNWVVETTPQRALPAACER